MKAIVIDAFGGPGQLHLVNRPVPPPTADEILIELPYTSINPSDWKVREGYLRESSPHMFPLIPGWDAAGIVRQLGAGVTGYKVGERVFAYARKPTVQWGTYAEYVSVPVTAVARVPATINLAQAATIPLTGLTAWQALIDFAEIQAGQTVLIHGGAGGVGGMAIQLARSIGAKVYTTACKRNHDYVCRLGAYQAIDYSATNFLQALHKSEPGGVDVVLDTVGGPVLRESYRALKRGGTLVSVVDRPDIVEAGKMRTGYVSAQPDGTRLSQIADLLARGVIKPPRLEEMRLEEAAVAQERSRGRHIAGKIVLRIK
ncbi:MAG: NADP-dependent oxidoreductase [Gammaproteobacteria bacterium]|nr:NADP-dependent oxidoreductase [Gammaproteobacteria bacterium]